MIGGLNIKEKIEELIRRYSRQLERSRAKESDFEQRKENLSVHGHWSLGYFGGRASLYEDIIDDLNDLIDNDKTGFLLMDAEIVNIDEK